MIAMERRQSRVSPIGAASPLPPPVCRVPAARTHGWTTDKGAQSGDLEIAEKVFVTGAEDDVVGSFGGGGRLGG